MNCVKCKKEIPCGSAYCNWCGKRQSDANQKKRSKSRGNGTGSVYKKNGSWWAEITLGYTITDSGKLKRNNKTKGGFQTKKEALAFIPKLKELAMKKEEHTTIAKIFPQWRETAESTISKSKLVAYDIAFKKFSNRVLYSDIADLTFEDLQNNVSDAASTYYPARDMKTLLSHMYKRAMLNQYVAVNLAEYIVLPKLEEATQSAFAEEEVSNLWEDYAEGHIFTGYILLMIYTGMMPGELMIVTKDKIDWGNQQIAGAGMKTKKRKETPIILSDFIIPVLHTLCDAYPDKEKLLPMDEKVFRKKFAETLERTGCRPLKPYSCRHTTATALAANSVTPSVIKEIMRHAKFETTQRYIHVDTDATLQAVNNLKKKD